MGTLLEQPVRRDQEYSENIEIEKVKTLSYKHEISIQETIDILKFLEMKRQNDLYQANGDIHDEQMAGLGELLTSLNQNIESIVTILEDKR